MGVWDAASSEAAKALYGRPLRVLLAGWILRHESTAFYTQEAQQAMSVYGEASSGVITELRNFAQHGMLKVFEDGRRTYYAPTGSPHWSAFEAIALAFSLMPQGRSDDPTGRAGSLLRRVDG